jgi:SAM-dependent methyltransferase
VLPLIRRVAVGKRILEVGVGAGDMSASLGALGYSVEGIDASPPAVAEATHRTSAYPNVHVRQLDLFDIGDVFESGSFDGAVAMEVLEHVADDRLGARLLHDALKPGGLLVISVPADPEKFDEDDRAVGHYRRYTREQIRALLEEVSFVVEGVWCYGFPLGNVLKRMRARRTAPAPADAVPEELSHHSGIRADIPGWLKPLIRPSTMQPFLLAQRLFLDRDLGEGYVVLARRRR